FIVSCFLNTDSISFLCSCFSFLFLFLFTSVSLFLFFFFFFNATATPEIYTLSLHDALPICHGRPLPRAGPDESGTACIFAAFTPDRKSTRLNSSHVEISYAVFCLKKKKKKE